MSDDSYAICDCESFGVDKVNIGVSVIDWNGVLCNAMGAWIVTSFSVEETSDMDLRELSWMTVLFCLCDIDKERLLAEIVF